MNADKQQIEQMYLQQQMSDRQIAAVLCVPPHQIRLARKAFGIASRPRGHNLTSTQRPDFDYGSAWRGKHHTAETCAKISQAAQQQVNRPSGQFHPFFGAFGDRNPNYKHGRSDERAQIYSTYEWRCIIKFVYIRDGGECQRCGWAIPSAHKQRHHHHIAAWDDYPELRLDADNVILLCRACHEWVHSAANVDRHFLLGVKES